jgi:hypothetical protein
LYCCCYAASEQGQRWAVMSTTWEGPNDGDGPSADSEGAALAAALVALAEGVT